jgi:toxin ParE1/3/4
MRQKLRGEDYLVEPSDTQTQPAMGRPGRIAGTRELVVPDTPYVIPYRVRRERLELIAVFHGHQKWPLKR